MNLADYHYQTFIIPIQLASKSSTTYDNTDFPNLIDSFVEDGRGIVEYYDVYKVSQLDPIFNYTISTSNIYYSHIIIIRVYTYFRPILTLHQKNERVKIKHGCNVGLKATICKCLPNNKYKVIVQDGSVRTYLGDLVDNVNNICTIGQFYIHENKEYYIYKAEDKEDVRMEGTGVHLKEIMAMDIETWQGVIYTNPDHACNLPRLTIRGIVFERDKLVYKYNNNRNKKTKGAVCKC